MKRHLPQQLHLVIASGILLAALVLVYQIVGRHNHRLDLTQERLHSLFPETVAILREMRASPIEVKAFFSEEDEARRDFEVLLKEMATHHPRFNYRFLDPDRSPGESRRYRIEAYRTTVIEYEKRQERIRELSEEAMANALIRLAHPQNETLCFTKGHGEISLADEGRTGLSGWKQVLESQHYRVKEIQIGGKGIPKDCNTLVMAGPHYELLPKELDELQRELADGRSFFLLVDPMDPGQGKSFIELLRPFGVKLSEDVVVDKVSQVFGGDHLIPMVTEYADHPVTKRFSVATFLPVARTIRSVSAIPKDIKVTELARTTQGSWAETDLKKLEDGTAEFEPETDLPGPVSLAVAVEIGKGPRQGRIVAVGDSDFATNAYLPISGNKDFTLNILQWLVRDDRWIAIRAKVPRFQPIILKVNRSVGVAAFTIGGLPLVPLVIGSIGIWVRRRRSE